MRGGEVMLPVNQILCGDNVETMKQFPADSVDLVVTSPPYDNLRTYGGHSWDFQLVADQLWRSIKPGGVVVWVVADQTIDGSESGESFRQALRFKEIGFRLHDTMIWSKDTFSLPFPNRYHQTFEYMFVFSKGSPTFNPISDRRNKHSGSKVGVTVRETCDNMTRRSDKNIAEHGKRFNVWKCSVEKGAVLGHPAPFPESLARDHILSWSNENDIVLDPFAGSGTTCRKAKDLGRKWIGIEVNPDYVEIINKRMAQQVLDF